MKPSAATQGQLTLTIDVARPDARRTVVAVSGEVDLSTSGDLRDALATAVHESTGSVHVDLSQVSFLDSSGINALLEGYAAAKRRDIPLQLVSPHAHVRQILRITGLAEVFGVADS